MDDLTVEKLNNIRDFIENTDGSYPDLSDLPAMWDVAELGERYPKYPDYASGTILLASYLNFSHTKRWAWDGLDRLHKVLMKRREPIPELLQMHVNLTYAGLRKAPKKIRNPDFAPKDGRDLRIHARIQDPTRTQRVGKGGEGSAHACARSFGRRNRPFGVSKDAKLPTIQVGN